MKKILAICALLSLSVPAAAQNEGKAAGSPLIDFSTYGKLTRKVEPYRQKRLLTLSAFMARVQNKDVLLLDARSERAFNEGHIEGAINVPLPDFTAEKLAEIVGDNPDREILIYCNNNFINNVRPVPMKSQPLALNIGTFINLYGYGYKNVYELGEAIDMNAPEVKWVKSNI